MIFDCFVFFQEHEILDLRLRILDKAVDRFVLLEANSTFSGKPKPFSFEENKARFSEFLPRIVHIKYTRNLETSNPWDREIDQRNGLFSGAFGIQDPPPTPFSLAQTQLFLTLFAKTGRNTVDSA